MICGRPEDGCACALRRGRCVARAGRCVVAGRRCVARCLVVIRRGVIPASRGGKLKTLLQGLAIGLYVLPLSGALATGRTAVMALAVAVTVVPCTVE